MIWLTWRQQRTETLIAALLLALLAALLVPTGLHIGSVYHHDGIAACLTHDSTRCNILADSFQRRFEGLANLLGWLNLLPGLIGILLAAPFVLELEHGTYRLAWTQSVTRRRWLTTKIGLIVLGALAASFALTLLMSWWRSPFDHLEGRLQDSSFDFEGTVPFAYTLFAVGLVLAVGAVLRRTLPTIGVAFVGFFVARIATVTWLRERYRAPLTKTWAPNQPHPDLHMAWVLDQGPSDRAGHALSDNALISACGNGVHGTPAIPSKLGFDASCLVHHGIYTHAVYQPASRFWLFQGIETALYGGIALALVGFAVWWVKRRIA